MSEKPTVLIIDDEMGPRESMRMLLKPQYEVVCADGVEKGLAELQRAKPDAVVMDIRMPGVDGIEGLRRIRKLDSNVAVIMLTGYGTLDTARSAIQLGANDYVKKPFDTKEMLKVVADNIRRTDFNRHITETERNLRNMNEVLMAELEQKRGLAKLGQASRELAHDLQNPLTIVVGSVELLASELKKAESSLYDADDPEGGDQAREYISVIEQSLTRCTKLLNVWRNLGRGDDLDLTPRDLGELLEKLHIEAKAMARNRQVAFNFETRDLEHTEVLVDAVQFPRTLMNLIGNALDALPPENGMVSLEAEKDGKRVRILIRDNGHGIPEDLLQKIFEPYFTTKQEGKGTGLGLFIARRIVDRHGGKIEVESHPGIGTTFSILLPVSMGKPSY